MNPALKEVETALSSVQESMRGARLDSCDESDVQELIDRVEAELEAPRPNVQVIGTFLNSIAKSLRTQPNTKEAVSRIDDALRKVGVASTWTN
jgi:hypothetical protein